MQKQSIRKVYPRSVLSPREGIFIPREGIYFSPLVTNDMSVINKNTSVLMNNMPLLMNKVPLLMNKVSLLHHLQFVFRAYFNMVTSRMPLMSLLLHSLMPIPAFQCFGKSACDTHKAPQDSLRILERIILEQCYIVCTSQQYLHTTYLYVKPLQLCLICRNHAINSIFKRHSFISVNSRTNWPQTNI